ncbi:MAG TPA: thermonuclease family protein [Polyangia bacterium]|nr:thermonuclease family protein [Polyangia bacterium]
MVRGAGSRRPRPRRILNRTNIGGLVLAFAAAGMLWRMLRPYWKGPDEVPPRPLPAVVDEVPAPTGEAVPLVRVVDGDTVRVRWRGEDQPVRLLRIDTPERGQRGFGEATLALRGILRQGPVEIEFERPGREERDRYGRLLAYVIAPDGRNASTEMVRLGHSRFHVKFGRGRLAAVLEAAEGQARLANAGLWTTRGWNTR